MAKVFLSHSSEDKEWYVNIVYKKLVKALGEDSVVIDNVVFQEGSPSYSFKSRCNNCHWCFFIKVIHSFFKIS